MSIEIVFVSIKNDNEKIINIFNYSLTYNHSELEKELKDKLIKK